MRIKILIVAESPVLPTGMGETIRLLFGALIDTYPNCYELHQLALFHTFSVAEPRWRIYTTKGVVGDGGYLTQLDVSDTAGARSFPEVAQNVRPDIVFAFNDPQRIMHLCVPTSERSYRLVIYVNFDGLPFPAGGAEPLKNADLSVTMTDFSRRVLLAALPGLDPERVRFMYPPADVARFQAVPPEARVELRRKWFPPWISPDAFVLGWVGRNQWRKQVWLIYEVIAHLRRGGYYVCRRCQRITLPLRRPKGGETRTRAGKAFIPPEQSRSAGRVFPGCKHCGFAEVAEAAGLPNVVLWVHMIDEASNDWQRGDLEGGLGLVVGRDIVYTQEHRVGNWAGVEEMPELYNVWDGLLYLSGGEGFGLPAWEAMICGLPVIYTNYSGHAEFLARKKECFPVGGVLQPENETCIFRMIADVAQTLEAVLTLLRRSQERGRITKTAFFEPYTSRKVAESWHNCFGEVLRCKSEAGK